jgi:hypothetical protein
MYWRLTLDTQMETPTEPGFIRSVHAADFSQREGVYTNTWRDPVTRLLWLKPSWLSGDYASNMRGYGAWSVKDAGMWQPVTRSPQETSLFSLVYPQGWAYTDVELTTVGTYLQTVDPDTEDTLYWAMVSREWSLAADEGFVVYYHNLTDELMRRANWFALQWGNLFLHISGAGEYRLYAWTADSATMTGAPTLQHAGSICGPGQQMARTGFLAVTPVPGMGIALHYPQAMAQGQQQAGSSEVAVGHGVLVPYPGKWDHAATGPVIAEASALTIALNPYTANVMAVQQTRYAASGTFVDGWFDPMTLYTAGPAAVTPTCMPYLSAPNPGALVTGALLGPAGAYVAGTDRMGRVQLTLTTSNTTYTPFVVGHTVEWAPVRTARTTTPYVVPKVTAIEWSQDEQLRNEGSAEMLLEGVTAQAIAQRGDTTCLLEYSHDETTWVTAFDGIARDWELDTGVDASGTWYRAKCSLRDRFWRIEEAHVNLQSAFDWMTVANAVDTVLKASGWAAIVTQSPALANLFVPGSATGRTWRYAPNLGDSGIEALDTILLHTRTQQGEWILRYDYTTDGWVTEQRASSTVTGALTFTPYSDDRDPDADVFAYSQAMFRPEPPEANVIQIMGVTDPDSGAIRYCSPPMVNQDSLDDETSPDYLGRAVLLLGTLGEAPTSQEVLLMARRVYDAVAHRRIKATLQMADWHTTIVPNVYVTIERDGGETLAEMWIKRRTIRVQQGMGLTWPDGLGAALVEGYVEEVTLELDTQWERELHG